MNKKQKIRLIVAMIVLPAVLLIGMIKIQEYIEKKPYRDIEKYLANEEYDKLNNLFKEIAYNDEKLNNNILGITKKEAEEIEKYFFVKKLYKEKSYQYVALHLKGLKPDLCWKFREDAKKFKKSFFCSKEGKKWKKYWQDEMEENELLEKRKIEWMENNLYNIAPYEYLPAEKICDTMLGYPKEVISRNYYKKNIFHDNYEKYYNECNHIEGCVEDKTYIWKDKNLKVICEARICICMDKEDSCVIDVDYQGNNWKNEEIKFGNSSDNIVIMRYNGSLYENDFCNKVDLEKIYSMSKDDVVDMYRNSKNVYSYSDPDNFYFNYNEYFDNYDEAKEYFYYAWSLIDEETKSKIPQNY